MKPYILLAFLLMLSLPQTIQAQDLDDEKLYSMSLEELMNVKINSVSKKDESLFDAPLSSYTITRSDIVKAGSTSIMEALRLAPGVIVREQTNGVYDIHIRGFDNILRYSEDYTKSNTATLVMIDNRPVFNHNLGGTFWETLPIDINDVDRIEVVRGPSAPMFGPNAVIGVINIITRRTTSKTHAHASLNGGTPSTIIANAGFGKKFNEQFSFDVTANYQKRERFEDLYYNGFGSFVPASGITEIPDQQYPNPETSLNRYGVNTFMKYGTKNVSIDLSAGLQNSQTQKNFLGNANGSLFTTNESNSQYANLSAKIYGLNLRTSLISGTDNLNMKRSPNQYDYTVSDIVGEYDFYALDNKIHIVPGVSFQRVAFDDADYLSEGTTFLNGNQVEINTSSAWLRTDMKPAPRWRVVAALRADKFSAPDDLYLAYEFATTYKLSENNLIRAAVTRSNSGSFIANNFLDLNVPIAPGVNFTRQGQQDLDLFTIQLFEIGYRSKLSKDLQIDIDVFRQHASNFTSLLITGMASQKFANIPTTATQYGLTFALNYVPNQNIQIKPFITFQETETEELLSAYISPNINPLVTTSSGYHRNTPSFYGGYYIDWKAAKKLNLNLNGYFFASHNQYHAAVLENTSEDIHSTFLLNMKLSYEVTSQLNLYFNGRNILNSNTREYFGTDRIGGLYMIGASFNLN